MNTLHTYNAQTFLPKAIKIANFYGFTPLEALVAKTLIKNRLPIEQAMIREADDVGGAIAGTVRTCVECDIGKREKKVLPFFAVSPLGKKSGMHNLALSMHAVGQSKLLAEALVLRSALSILEENSVKDPVIHLTSVGDKDSVQRFVKEIQNFFKRHALEISPEVRAMVAEQPIDALRALKIENPELFDVAPRSLDYLTELSRKHFREVIEFLELSGMPYAIDDRVIPSKASYSHTIVELRGSVGGHDIIAAKGGRYDDLGKRLFKQPLPGMGIVFTASSEAPKPTMRESHIKPKVFFIQVGQEARMRSFSLIETLRRVKIPLAQALAIDGLSDQLAIAESLKVPYSVIVGHREAIEGTAILRSMHTRAQDTLPASMLPERLKAII